MGISKDGVYVCDFCGDDNGKFDNETGNHAVCALLYDLTYQLGEVRTELQDTLDLLRTGTAPMTFGMTEQQWLDHKCNKAAYQIDKILKKIG